MKLTQVFHGRTMFGEGKRVLDDVKGRVYRMDIPIELALFLASSRFRSQIQNLRRSFFEFSVLNRY